MYIFTLYRTSVIIVTPPSLHAYTHSLNSEPVQKKKMLYKPREKRSLERCVFRFFLKEEDCELRTVVGRDGELRAVAGREIDMNHCDSEKGLCLQCSLQSHALRAAGQGSAGAPGYPQHAPDAQEGPRGAAGQGAPSASGVSGTVQDHVRHEEVPVQGGGRPRGVLAPGEPPQEPQQEAGGADHAAAVRGQGQVNDRHSQGVQAIPEQTGRRGGLDGLGRSVRTCRIIWRLTLS